MYNSIEALYRAGFSVEDATALRRISMTLHRWYEMECGLDRGVVERDEVTDRPYWLNSTTMKRSPIPDRETGAYKRLAKIMERYPDYHAYCQTDPRGCALYIVRKDLVPMGERIDSYYSRGIPVCK